MEEISDKHLKFLDFILSILNGLYPNGETLNFLAHKYKKESGIILDWKEQEHFQKLFDCEYFKTTGTLDFVIITSETKEIIDNYGSLSKFIEEKNKEILSEQSKIEKKEQLEIELSKSNIDANKLNKEIAKKNEKNNKRNRIFTLVNIIIGFINIALIVWQILK